MPGYGWSLSNKFLNWPTHHLGHSGHALGHSLGQSGGGVWWAILHEEVGQWERLQKFTKLPLSMCSALAMEAGAFESPPHHHGSSVTAAAAAAATTIIIIITPLCAWKVCFVRFPLPHPTYQCYRIAPHPPYTVQEGGSLGSSFYAWVCRENVELAVK